ncbi:hypothetical protein BHM03_00046095, partial [Ensete ventricosum]
VSELAALFQADSAALLAANAIDVSFPGVENRILPAGLFLRVPAACSCSGGIRRSLSTRYTVRPADTLTSIAASVYSGLATPDQIREANNIRDPAALDVGRTLVIPLPCTCFNSTDNNLPAVYLSYVVLAGDSVPSIAARFSTTITDIMNVNAMGSPSVRPGDILAIPLPAKYVIFYSSCRLTTSLQPRCPEQHQLPPVIPPPTTVIHDSFLIPSPSPSPSSVQAGATITTPSSTVPGTFSLPGVSPAYVPSVSTSEAFFISPLSHILWLLFGLSLGLSDSLF